MVKFIKLIVGSSTNMPEIESNSVHLVCTSPPYLNVKQYGNTEEQIGNLDESKYYDVIEKVYRECFRVLKPGRRMIVNCQDIPRHGEFGQNWHVLGFGTIQLMRKIGFELSDLIVWNKGHNRSGETPMGTCPYPASPVLLANWEHILVFRKYGKVDYSHVTEIDRKESCWFEDMGEYMLGVWSFRPETGNSDIHPAMFPSELPRRIIRMYSFQGETVLEPFCGSGTTLSVARELKRSVIGFEIEEKYVPYIMKKVGWNQTFVDNPERYEYEIVRRK